MRIQRRLRDKSLRFSARTESIRELGDGENPFAVLLFDLFARHTGQQTQIIRLTGHLPTAPLKLTRRTMLVQHQRRRRAVGLLCGDRAHYSLRRCHPGIQRDLGDGIGTPVDNFAEGRCLTRGYGEDQRIESQQKLVMGCELLPREKPHGNIQIVWCRSRRRDALQQGDRRLQLVRLHGAVKHKGALLVQGL
jgi:hypothetical protein